MDQIFGTETKIKQILNCKSQAYFSEQIVELDNSLAVYKHCDKIAAQTKLSWPYFVLNSKIESVTNSFKYKANNTFFCNKH